MTAGSTTEALPPHSEELSLFLGVQGSRITHIVDAYARQAVAADRAAIRAGDASNLVPLPKPLIWRWKNSQTGGSGFHPNKGHGNPEHSHIYTWDAVYGEDDLRTYAAAFALECNKGHAGDAAPDGVWVPRVATTAQRLAMAKADDESGDRYRLMAAAMLAAAPQPTRVDKGVEVARQPLTYSALEDIARQAHIAFCLDKASSFELAFARLVEKAHGIVSAPLVAGGEQP